jgi:hypothetical protein
VQVFDGNGKYDTQCVNMHRPCGLYCCRGPKLQFIIGEFGPDMNIDRNHPNLGPRLSIVDAKGKLLARLVFPEVPIVHGMRSLQKLKRVS